MRLRAIQVYTRKTFRRPAVRSRVDGGTICFMVRGIHRGVKPDRAARGGEGYSGSRPYCSSSFALRTYGKNRGWAAPHWA